MTTTSRLRRATEASTTLVEGSKRFTPILDGQNSALVELGLLLSNAASCDLDFLRAAHHWIRENIRPVYSLDETQHASTTLAKGRGSCSQRIGILEALASGAGIATRSEALLIHGSFWYPRFPHLRWLVPQRIIIAWPDFALDSGWLNLSDLFGSDQPLGPVPAFKNQGAETLFDAVAAGTAHWIPRGCTEGSCLPGNLAQVDRSLGHFPDRDEVFARYGENLPLPMRVVLEPFFGRWSAVG